MCECILSLKSAVCRFLYIAVFPGLHCSGSGVHIRGDAMPKTPSLRVHAPPHIFSLALAGLPLVLRCRVLAYSSWRPLKGEHASKPCLRVLAGPRRRLPWVSHLTGAMEHIITAIQIRFYMDVVRVLARQSQRSSIRETLATPAGTLCMSTAHLERGSIEGNEHSKFSLDLAPQPWYPFSPSLGCPAIMILSMVTLHLMRHVYIQP